MKELEKLLKIMDDLRSKCPWDKKQTLSILKNLTIEETYELTEAIENKNFKNTPIFDLAYKAYWDWMKTI